VSDFPVKLRRVKAQEMKVAIALIYNQQKVLIYQKAPDGLIGGLWAFPYQAVKRDDSLTLKDTIFDQFGMRLGQAKLSGQTKHVFTHQLWDMTLYAFEVEEAIWVEDPKMMWATLSDIEAIPMSTAMKRVLPFLQLDR
jgi:A/G-specific adenine glycosylase